MSPASNKLVVHRRETQNRVIDQFMTISEYFTKTDIGGASLVAARLNGTHSRRRNRRSEKVFFVLEGKLDITIGQEKFPLQTGDAAVVRVGVLHSMIGNNASLLIIVSPPFDPLDEAVE